MPAAQAWTCTWTWTNLGHELPPTRCPPVAVRFLPLGSEIAAALPQRHAALAAELRRAPLSMPLNIAQGSGKTTGPDQRRFYAMAPGSAMECVALVDACVALTLVESAPAHSRRPARGDRAHALRDVPRGAAVQVEVQVQVQVQAPEVFG
jgi:four helix bundle protein